MLATRPAYMFVSTIKGNFTFTDLRGTRYDNRQWGGSLEGRVIRYDPTSGANGTLLRFSTTAPAIILSGIVPGTPPVPFSGPIS